MKRMPEETSNPFSRFLVIWTGELISLIGSGLTSFGLGVYVYQVTGKVSGLALVSLLAFLPALLLSPVAGVLADRYDRRLLMLLGDSLSALGILFILICMLLGDAQLWQICIGVTISSVFSSLLEPAYRATITDLLSQEDYTKASGLVQAAGSSKYLISPILAGYLLRVFDIKLLLIIDICTFFVTASSILFVRRSLASQRDQGPASSKGERGPASSNSERVSASSNGEWSPVSGSMRDDFREGWHAVSGNRGVLVLVLMGSVITFFLGFIQTLSTPMILAFTDSSALGTTLTLSACGMLITSVFVGIIPMKHNFVNKLCASLFGAGIFMAVFGLRENIILICAAGFLFFSMLPFANTSLDYLIRTNIGNELQGRAWGLIGVISQLGYVAAYAVSGILADRVFTPLLVKGGALSGSVGLILGIGTGRGTGFLILIAGLLLSISAIILLRIKSIRALETH